MYMSKTLNKILSKLFDKDYNKLPSNFWTEFKREKVKEISILFGIIVAAIIFIIIPATFISDINYWNVTSKEYKIDKKVNVGIPCPIIKNGQQRKFNFTIYTNAYLKHSIYSSNTKQCAKRYGYKKHCILWKRYSNKNINSWSKDSIIIYKKQPVTKFFVVKNIADLVVHSFIMIIGYIVIMIIITLFCIWLKSNYDSLKPEYRCKIHPNYKGNKKPKSNKKGCTCMQIYKRLKNDYKN